MAEVIKLQDWLDKLPRRVGEPCEARIILFTGVRYERLTDTTDHPHTHRTGTRRKKS